jgi:AcrR family transcriptional regulator
MSRQRPHDLAREKKSNPYHHGDLATALRAAARTILEEEGLDALSLRSVARKAGVSHAAPYRHFASREALLVEIALEGFEILRADIRHAGSAPGLPTERIVHIGAAYARFAAQHGGLLQLMFGKEIPNRFDFPELEDATNSIPETMGDALGDQVLGLAVWGTVHGIAILCLENILDLGQRQAGMDVLPSRAEILLRSLFSQPLE